MYYLRELTRQDVVTVNQWRNDPELISHLGASFAYTNLERDDAWYDNYLKNRKTNVRCAIVRKADDKLIGVMYLLGIDPINRSGELGIMIGDSTDRGKGAGRYALETMLRHAFLDLNLNRVEFGALSENTRALKLYEAIGFRTEGVRRQARYKNGAYRDLTMMAMLREEWSAIHGE